MNKQAKISEISANLRLAALNLGPDNIEEKNKLIQIAQGLDNLGAEEYGVNNLLGGDPQVNPQEAYQTQAGPSKFGIDQEQQRYYKVSVEFLYITASDNQEARNKIIQALASIDAFKNKFNVGEAQGMSVKEPS